MGPGRQDCPRDLALRGRRFYQPTRNGFEQELAERYEDIQRQLAERSREPGEEG